MMNDATITQLGLAVLYTAAAVLMDVLRRIERSSAFGMWTASFLLFAADAGVSALAHACKLPPAARGVAFVALGGAAIMALVGALASLGKRLPQAVYWLGAILLVSVVSGLTLGMSPSTIQPVVFAVIAVALAWGSVAVFRAGVPGGAGRWVLGTGFFAGALYAAIWPFGYDWPLLARLEYHLDLTVLLWGAMGVLVMHFDRIRERLQHLAAQELELREQLARAERLEALGRLAAGVAHDFNNVLAVVVNGSEVVLRQIDDRPKPAAHLRMVLEAAREAAGFTRQLLALGRRDLPGKKPRRLSDAIQAALRIIRPALSPRVALQCRPGDAEVEVLAAEGQLEQLVVNLTLNATDAMPEGGSLVIETTKGAPSPDEVRLVVRDDGVGMDEATRIRIFDPFFTTKSSSRGTGLGLTAVHAIITALGGKIAVTTSPGHGTSFTIDLPVCAASNGGAETIRPNLERSQVRVLVVDDEPQVARSLSEGLSALGYQAEGLSDPRDALGHALSHPPDLLLSDVRMLHLEGTELARSLRERWPELPVLFMTGHAPAPHSDDAAQRLEWLVKPFTLDELDAAIHTLLDDSGPRAASGSNSRAAP